MKPETDPEEFTRLVSRLFDEELTDRDRARLQQILEADADARMTYLQLVDMQVKMSCIVLPAVEADDERETSQSVVPIPDAFPWRWAAAALVAAGLLLNALLTRLDRPVDRAGARPGPTNVGNAGRSPGPPLMPVLAPDAWGETFESGPVEGWIGRWTEDGLPSESGGGIESVTLTNRFVRYHRISPPRWNAAGLFTVRSNSHLRMTYKVESPTWFNVFLGTRPEDPGEPPYVLHQFADHRLWSEAGRWRRAVIPLRQFQRKVDGVFTDAPPVAGEAAMDLFFSAVDNGLALTIDRIEITSDGPGALELSDLE